MNECKQFQADLTDYARGEYKYIKDFDALFNHLRECEECRNKFFELESLFKALRPPYEPSPQFLKRMEELKEMFKKGPPPEQEIKDEGKKMIAAGIELYKKQKWFEAAKVFDELVKKEPNNANAYYHRGIAHQRMNLLDEAITDFTKAIELDNDDADAYFHRAQIYYNNLEWDKSVPDLNRAIRLNPDYAEAYYGLGMIDEQIGEWKKAIEDFSAVIEREPDNALAYFHRGINYTLDKSNDSARKDFKKSIELIPDEPAAYLNIGITYAIEDNMKEAMNWFKQSLKINPKYGEAKDVIKMAQTQIKAQDIEERGKIKKPVKIKKEIKEIEEYKMRIKELEAENKMLKEFQKELLVLIAQQRPEYTYQTLGKAIPEAFTRPTGSSGREGTTNFPMMPFEGKTISPKNIQFPTKP